MKTAYELEEPEVMRTAYVLLFAAVAAGILSLLFS
jgi:hypothetical protein